MSAFLSAARRVLDEEGVPLTVERLTALARERGYLRSTGKTPSQTMKSKLAIDILRRGERSPFMRTAPALFGLRSWRGQHREYHAERFQKALFDEDIVVFRRTHLPRLVPGPGIHSKTVTAVDLRSIVSPMRRRDAEADQSVVQLVSVFVIRHNESVMTYKRTARLPEARLRGEYSIGFGGHLNPDDVPALFDLLDPTQSFAFIERELREEVILPPGELKDLQYRGLLYDDSREVSRQHLGIVYEVTTGSPKVEIGERGFLMSARFESVDQVGARLDDFENWSVLLYQDLRRRCPGL